MILSPPATRRRCWRAPLAAVVVLLAGALPARGQNGDAVVITKRTEIDWFHLDALRFALELDYHHRDDTLSMSGGATDKETEDRFREVLEMSGRGFFGHPNIADLNFTLRFSLEQEDLDSDRVQNRRSDNFINEFDVSSQLFKRTSMPIRVWGRRNQATLDQTFAGSVDSTVTELGTQIQFVGGMLPNSLTYIHRIQENDGNQDRNDYKIVQDSVQSQGSLRGIPGRLNWDYTFDDSSETGGRASVNDFQRHDLDVVHSQRFGENDENNLRSSFQYRHESGDRESERLLLDERLTLNFSPQLNVFLNYDYVTQEFTGPRQSQHSGSIQFTHRLFESLVTGGTLTYLDLAVPADDFRSEQLTSSLSFNYNKKVPNGRLGASISLGHTRQDTSPIGAPFQVADEAHTFDASDRFVIMRRSIDIASVFITDTTGLIVYVEGLDYDLQPFADRLEVRRIITGTIAMGQTVLVDYVIGPEPGGRNTTEHQSYTVRYGIDKGPLRGLSLRLRYRTVDETRPVVAGVMFPEADTDDFLAGLEFARDQLTLSGEWQRVESISSVDRYNLTAGYVWPIGSNARFGVDAAYSQTDSEEDDNRTRSTTIAAVWSQRIDQRWRVNYNFRWLNEEDSNSLATEGIEHRLDTHWQYRQTRITARLRANTLDTNVSDRDMLSFGINFRREF